MTEQITVEITVDTSIDKSWEVWNEPKHIIQWCSGHPDWHTTKAVVNLKVGGQMHSRMEAKDGSMGFDIISTYDAVDEPHLIKYHMEDGRKCEITFETENQQTKITQKFDPETQNTPGKQKEGWQTIMNNFKIYIENL